MLNDEEKLCYKRILKLLEHISELHDEDLFYIYMSGVGSEVYNLIEELKSDYANRVFKEIDG